ncbi:hypothetical protein WJX84_010968 [Apatococcus fuscideae]|uniref:Uncharacterized protein n=1 Tax=Apatococcus fuscideae TaxID=2026836 RepID=A0AAW1SUX6_9CHLO
MDLVKGIVARLAKGELADESVVLQVTELQPSKGGKYSCKLGDGSGFLDAVATKQVSQIIARGEIKNDQIVRVTNHTLNEVAGTQKLIWLDCEVLPPARDASKATRNKAVKSEPSPSQPSPASASRMQTATAVNLGGDEVPQQPAAEDAKAEPMVEDILQTDARSAAPALPAVKEESASGDMEVETDAAEAKENMEAAANVDTTRQPLAPQSAAKRMKLEPSAGTPAASSNAVSRIPRTPQEQPKSGTPAAVEAKHEHGPLAHAASKALTTPHVTRALVASEPAFGTPPSRTAPGSGALKTPGTGPGSTGRKAQPIAALNPYMSGWTIKARMASKDSLRSFNRGSETISVFTCELVDEQGTQIEATLWRQTAEAQHSSMQEGKVYYVSKGKVKPANRQYSSVRNDYQIHLDAG